MIPKHAMTGGEDQSASSFVPQWAKLVTVLFRVGADHLVASMHVKYFATPRMVSAGRVYGHACLPSPTGVILLATRDCRLNLDSSTIAMASTASFDISTGADLQEVDNAVNQAVKEVARTLRFQRHALHDRASIGRRPRSGSPQTTQFRMDALVDVLQTRMIKRGVRLRT